MTYKEVKQNEFACEYGTAGDEFYVILEGECEFLVPNEKDDEFKNVNRQIVSLSEKIIELRYDVKNMFILQREYSKIKIHEEEDIS